MGTILSTHGGSPTPPHDGAPADGLIESRKPMRPAAIALATGLILALVIAGVTLLDQRAQQSIRGLPPSVRHDVYETALTEIRGVCLQPAAQEGALREHCLEQARFLERFPECTADCRAAVSRVQPPPARN